MKIIKYLIFSNAQFLFNSSIKHLKKHINILIIMINFWFAPFVHILLHIKISLKYIFNIYLRLTKPYKLIVFHANFRGIFIGLDLVCVSNHTNVHVCHKCTRIVSYLCCIFIFFWICSTVHKPLKGLFKRVFFAIRNCSSPFSFLEN